MPKSMAGPNEELIAHCLAKAREAAEEVDEQVADAAYEEALIALGPLGKRDPRYLDILDEMARMFRLEDGEKTEAVLLRRLALQREIWGARSAQEAGELCYLASYYAAENRHDDAIDTYRQALRLFTESEPQQLEAVASLRMSIAHQLTTREPNDEAEEAWALAMESAIDAFGADSLRIGPVWLGMAELRRGQRHFEEAEEAASMAIALALTREGNPEPPLSVSFSLLATVYHEDGRHAEELAALRDALEAMDAEPDVNPLALPALLERLARSEAALGDLDEAASYYDRSIKAWNAVAWPIGARPELLDEYAEILRRNGRTEAAETLAKQAEYDRSMRHQEFDCENADEYIDWLQRHGKGPGSTRSA